MAPKTNRSVTFGFKEQPPQIGLKDGLQLKVHPTNYLRTSSCYDACSWVPACLPACLQRVKKQNGFNYYSSKTPAPFSNGRKNYLLQPPALTLPLLSLQYYQSLPACPPTGRRSTNDQLHLSQTAAFTEGSQGKLLLPASSSVFFHHSFLLILSFLHPKLLRQTFCRRRRNGRSSQLLRHAARYGRGLADAPSRR